MISRQPRKRPWNGRSPLQMLWAPLAKTTVQPAVLMQDSILPRIKQPDTGLLSPQSRQGPAQIGLKHPLFPQPIWSLLKASLQDHSSGAKLHRLYVSQPWASQPMLQLGKLDVGGPHVELSCVQTHKEHGLSRDRWR